MECIWGQQFNDKYNSPTTAGNTEIVMALKMYIKCSLLIFYEWMNAIACTI